MLYEVITLIVAVADDVFQDRVGILAKARTATPDLLLGSAHLRSKTIGGDGLTKGLILVLDPVAAFLIMLALGQFFCCARDAARHFFGFEVGGGFVGSPGCHPLFDQLVDLLAEL